MDDNEKWYRSLKSIDFQIGDRVLCIDRDSPAKLGDTGTVSELHDKSVAVYIMLDGHANQYAMLKRKWRLIDG